LQSFLGALGFLTVLPVGKRALEQKSLAGSAAYFPLVGLLLGFALAGADYGLRLAFSDNLILPSALVITLLVILTGALHFEGFVDSCDGLLGGHSQERRLEIMRDKRVGAYAVAGGILLLILKFAAIASLTADSTRFWILVLFPVLSRCGMSLALGLFPYVRAQGLGSAFRGMGAIQVITAMLISTIAAVLFGSTGGLILFASGTLFVVLLSLGIQRLIGGLTGDTYGAINELTEVIILVIGAAMVSHISILPCWQEYF